jgi:hypothetical protein
MNVEYVTNFSRFEAEEMSSVRGQGFQRSFDGVCEYKFRGGAHINQTETYRPYSIALSRRHHHPPAIPTRPSQAHVHRLSPASTLRPSEASSFHFPRAGEEIRIVAGVWEELKASDRAGKVRDSRAVLRP